MKQSHDVPRKHPSPLNNGFPTIGLFIEGLSGQYQAGVWPGISDTARKNNVNVICFCGGSLRTSSENPWDYQGNVLFKIAGKYPLDGCIISSSIGCYVPTDEFDEFLSRYRHLKTVTITPASETLPAVFVDNQSGMRSLISHLVECHGYRNIAFVRGPEKNQEAEDRYHIFLDVLAEHHIPVDPRRILQGDFTRNYGAAAVHHLISSKTEFDAIAAASDDMALGALQALRELGKKVPEDIAVVGFDDIDESGSVTPPLTTVHQPLYDLGKTAVETLLRLLRGEAVPQNTVIEGKLVIRQSCGCFNHAGGGVAVPQPLPPAPLQKELSESGAAGFCLEAVLGREQEVRDIVSGFCKDVNAGTDRFFLREVDRAGRRLVHEGAGLLPLSDIFHRLWRYAAAHCERSVFTATDDLIHRAISLCNEIAVREREMRRILAVRNNSLFHEIGDRLKNTLDADKLMDAICETFPHMGIHSLYLSLYESTNKTPAKTSVLKCAFTGDTRKKIGKEGIAFETESLIPPGIVPAGAAHSIIAEALYFQKEQFGIALFEAGLQESRYYDVLKEYISGALHSAALIDKIRQQSDVLVRAHNELKILRENEHAYLQAVKRELGLGRNIQLGFLPNKLPQVAGWEIAAVFRPAREVSGDFYDAFLLSDDRMALVIADVSGKDVSAALFMSLICTLIRVIAERAEKSGEDPLDAIGVVNDYITRHHFPIGGRSSMYATIVFGLLRPSSGELHYINAGHIPPMVIHGNAIVHKLAPTGPAVGLAPQKEFSQEKIILNPGDLLFSYTDGVTEAKNSSGNFFTAGRLMELLQKDGATAHEKTDRIIAALDKHYNGAAPYDDITMLAVKRG